MGSYSSLVMRIFFFFFSNENLREKASRLHRLKEYKFKVYFALG